MEGVREGGREGGVLACHRSGSGRDRVASSSL